MLRLNLIEAGYTKLADLAKRRQKHDLPLAAEEGLITDQYCPLGTARHPRSCIFPLS